MGEAWPGCGNLVVEKRSLEAIQTVVNTLSELLTGLKMRDVFSVELDALTGLGVSTHTRLTEMKAETAKTPDLDSLAGRETVNHLVDDALYRQLYILGG